MADQQQTPPGQPQRGFGGLMHQITTKKIETGLWATRILTVVFTIGYILPFFGNPYTSYYKALMANAATSALRLHQRLPRVQLSREVGTRHYDAIIQKLLNIILFQFLATVLLEDSAHYLFFSLIFLNSEPITVALMPVFLFAMLHAASYSLQLLDALGQNSWWGARMLISTGLA